MFDKSVLTKEIIGFSEIVVNLLEKDLIGICTDRAINSDGSSILDCFMAVINQQYAVELICVDELHDNKNNPVILTSDDAIYELTIVDYGGELYNFSDVNQPIAAGSNIKSKLSIYFYKYNNSLKVLKELMNLYNAQGV